MTHDPFPQGWLDQHIDAVVARLADRDPDLRPQLIGARARVMDQFDWSRSSSE